VGSEDGFREQPAADLWETQPWFVRQSVGGSAISPKRAASAHRRAQSRNVRGGRFESLPTTPSHLSWANLICRYFLCSLAPSGVIVVARLCAVSPICISVQIAWDGLTELIPA
jgi:hypothetical protein